VKITKSKLTDQQFTLLRKVQAKIDPIQTEVDALTAEYQAARVVLDEIGKRIKAKRPQLVPLAEKMAAITSINSRNKYFPEFLGRFDDAEKTAEFLAWAEESLI
jgi:hypothetical protein